MFARNIVDNNFCSSIGNEMFPRIQAKDYAGGDLSMVTVLRALLGNRTEEDVEAWFAVQDRAEPLDPNPNTLIFVELPDNPSEDDLFALDQLREKTEELMPGFKPIPAQAKFIKEQVDKESLFLRDEEHHRTVVYFCGLNVRYLHLLESFIPALLPWHFREKPVVDAKNGTIEDQEAVDLLMACSNPNASKFENAVAALYSRYDFREAIIKSKLRGFESKFHEAELDNVRRSIEQIRNSMEDLRRRISDYYQELDSKTTREAGLIQKIQTQEEGGSEVMDLFLTYKNIHLVSVNDTEITFVVDTVINNYDPEVFALTIENGNAFWYRTEGGRHYSRAWSDEQIKKFLKAIFEDEILKIKVCAAYSLDFARGRYRGNSHFTFDPQFADCMPNQHIQQFACLGSGHENQLYEAMNRRDYTGAINVCIASAGNMSMNEVPTGECHMKYLLGDNPGKCIILPDGSNVTPLDALKWLEAQDSKEE